MESKNIFADAQDNYFLIEPGEYMCKVNYFVSYIQDEYDVIEFYVRYIDKEIEKNISVKYIFSKRSKGKSMSELLEVLCSVHTELCTNGILTSKLFDDKKLLLDYCNSLIDKWLILNVEYKPKYNGSVYKSIRLKPNY